MKGLTPVKSILFIFFFSLFIIASVLNAQKIKIKTEKGIPVVYNPKKPDPPRGVKHNLILEEELCIGDDTEEYLFAEDIAFISMGVDKEGNIYTVDPKLVEIKKFSPEGKLIKVFGKRGQGPEEMDSPSIIGVTSQNELMFVDSGNSRITFYSLDGEYLRYIPAHKWRFSRTRFDSKGNVVADIYQYSEEEQRMKAIYEIRRFNQELEPLFTIISIDMTDELLSREYIYGGVRIYWQIGKNDNVYVGYAKNYEFDIINPEGKIIRKVKKVFDPVKVTEEEENRLPQQFRESINLPKYHTGFYYFSVDEEGRLFVRSWEKTEDKMSYLWDVYDPEGRYIAKIPINAYLKLWENGKLYTAEETEDGLPIIKRYKVIWK
ncbi:MAG: 6-bladed beta-propeller [Cyclobacteriaceae bacterium]|nr:6-bladed beta-propeller [Cyclobacteriaceae bacterium]